MPVDAISDSPATALRRPHLLSTTIQAAPRYCTVQRPTILASNKSNASTRSSCPTSPTRPTIPTAAGSMGSGEWRMRASICNDAGKTTDPNLVWSHSEAYGSAWENRNLRSIDTYRSCTKGLQKTAYIHLGNGKLKYM
ncbi:hypothetical protein EJ02DRAFT_51137 [Clathrospora elynae]|uniref:Uncharacterized protein n=1 Tax=Clathrospora elynae TaxID=706981 RepID=A0A6A5SX61_9PLEO|nr:hypothetical protein EJ02DRAFT_51137 [Clathrospora elynae]